MPDLKAVLFDLDNTLYHWDPCDLRGREAAYAVLRQEADLSFERFMVLHDEARDHLKKHLHGQSSNHNRVLFFKYMTDKLASQPRPGLVLAMHQQYWDAFFSVMQPHPDALPVLEQLRSLYKMALVSNHVAQPQLEKIVRLGFAPFFDLLITSEEAGVEKPNQRIFDLTLRQLSVPAHAAVMIGDNPPGDIEGAHRAGLHSIYMAEYTGGEPAPACADRVAHKLGDVLGLIESLAAPQ
jgi:putative hydrolase of the HAD superfamily